MQNIGISVSRIFEISIWLGKVGLKENEVWPEKNGGICMCPNKGFLERSVCVLILGVWRDLCFATCQPSPLPAFEVGCSVEML